MFERNARRAIFNDVAADYDAVRPAYPEAAIDEAIRLSGIPDEGLILEIGCGTGQATGSFLERDYRMVCLDIGPDMLRIAEAKFAGNPSVSFRQTSFEDFEGEAGAFDLVLAASSWHWVEPERGYRKAGAHLKPGGCLAVLATLHPKPYFGPFERIQSAYREIVPEWGDPNSSRTTDFILDAADEMRRSGCFGEVASFEVRWVEQYSTKQYLRLLGTYSDHFRLESAQREPLFDRIGRIIDEEYEGIVVRPYVTVGFVGRKSVAEE